MLSAQKGITSDQRMMVICMQIKTAYLLDNSPSIKSRNGTNFTSTSMHISTSKQAIFPNKQIYILENFLSFSLFLVGIWNEWFECMQISSITGAKIQRKKKRTNNTRFISWKSQCKLLGRRNLHSLLLELNLTTVWSGKCHCCFSPVSKYYICLFIGHKNNLHKLAHHES